MTSALEWPSLTVQWLPDKLVNVSEGYMVQTLLLGMHTAGSEDNRALLGGSVA